MPRPEESTTEIIDEDDKATLTKTTDLENAQKEAREQKPTAFDGITEPGMDEIFSFFPTYRNFYLSKITE